MKLLTTLAFTLATAAGLFAQTPAIPQGTPSPLPAGPLFKPIPSQIRWTIIRKGSQTGQTGAGTVAAAPSSSTSTASASGQPPSNAKEAPSPFDFETFGEKIGDVCHVITTYSNETKQEVWVKGLLKSVLRSGWKQPVIYSAGEDAHEELDWISSANFVGIQKIGGRDCIVFRDKILPLLYRLRPDLLRKREVPSDPAAQKEENRIKQALGIGDGPELDPERLKLPAQACIDLETRLPITVLIGKEVTSYKYEALPPGYTIVVPSEIASAMEVRSQQIQLTDRKMVLP